MHEDPNSCGPRFYPGLIGADGKLARLHKGASPPPAVKPPPPVRETARDVQQAKDDERNKVKDRQGYNATLRGGEARPGTLLGQTAQSDQTGRRTLLG
jgi:hypothetical protein